MINQKDMKDKYDELIDELENFKLQQNVTYNQSLTFINQLTEKENLILQYDEDICCFT